MKIRLACALSGLMVLSVSNVGAQTTTGIPGNQTRVPGSIGGSTFGGLLGRPGNAPAMTNENPGAAAGNPTNVPVGAPNTAAGNFNPLGAFGNQFAPQLPTGNNGNGMSAADVMRLRMLQNMGNNRRGPQYGPGYSGAPQQQPMVPNQPMAPNNAAVNLFDAKAQKEAEKAKARQRAEDIRAKEAEARERRKAKALEAKKQADAKAEEAPKAE